MRSPIAEALTWSMIEFSDCVGKAGTYMDRPALQGESLKGNKGKVAHIYSAFE